MLIIHIRAGRNITSGRSSPPKPTQWWSMLCRRSHMTLLQPPHHIPQTVARPGIITRQRSQNIGQFLEMFELHLIACCVSQAMHGQGNRGPGKRTVNHTVTWQAKNRCMKRTPMHPAFGQCKNIMFMRLRPKSVSRKLAQLTRKQMTSTFVDKGVCCQTSSSRNKTVGQCHPEWLQPCAKISDMFN